MWPEELSKFVTSLFDDHLVSGNEYKYIKIGFRSSIEMQTKKININADNIIILVLINISLYPD